MFIYELSDIVAYHIQEKELGYEPHSLKHADLARFQDDIVEFNDYCFFLYDALSAMFCETSDSEPDGHTIFEVTHHCLELKRRALRLEERFNKIYQKSYTASQAARLASNT